ncbi:hypothetical protein [Methylocystis rosea]|uniref:hypothetical protein n=1 Tax=Methylocystis rosea TaxID=173366 RepID=UPI0018DCBAC0|nr:hypothetical protein [Methylocystis rosea]
MKSKLASLFAAAFLAALSVSALAQTSTLPISSLPTAATPLIGNEYFPVVQSGATRKSRVVDVFSLADIPNIPRLNANNVWTATNTWGSPLVTTINTKGEITDASTIIASLQRFFEGDFYGTPTIGKVHRFNRGFFGEAALSSGGAGYAGANPPYSWIEQYVPRATSVATLAAGSPMGALAITGYARTSDYRTWTGTPTAGAEGGVFIGVNDDANGIAVGVDVRAIRAAKGEGIATNQFDAINLRPTFQTLRPYAALNTVSAGLIYPFLLTTGVANGGSGTVTISIASPGIITHVGHNRKNDDTITFTTTGALPTGLTAGTTYYIINKTADTYQVSATPGGAAINASGSQSGVHTATYNVPHEITAFGFMAGGVGAGLPATAIAQKGFVLLDGAVDKTYGLSGGGVFAELPSLAEIAWMKSDGTSSVRLWGDAASNLLVSNQSFYAAGNVTSLTNLIGRNIISASAVPVPSSCGTTPAVDANSTNVSGNFTTGTGSPTACTLTFANAYPTAAACTVTAANAAAVGTTVRVSPPAAASFTITLGAGTSSASFNYVCLGK